MLVALECLKEGGQKIPKRTYEAWNKLGRGVKIYQNVIETAMVSCHKIISKQHSQVQSVEQHQAIQHMCSANASPLNVALGELVYDFPHLINVSQRARPVFLVSGIALPRRVQDNFAYKMR